MKFFLLILIFNFNSLYAVEHRVMQADLDLEVKLTSLALEIGQEISDELEEKGIENLSEAQGDVVEIMQRKAINYAHAYDQFYSKKFEGEYKKGFFVELVNKINWHEIFLSTKELLKNSMGIFKIYGKGYIVAFIVGSALEYTSYYLFALFNLKLVLSVAVLIPYGKTLLLLPVQYHEFVHRKKMRKILGSRARYNAFLSKRREIKKKLRLTGPQKILFPLLEDLEEQGLKAAAISKESTIGKVLKSAKRTFGLEVSGLDLYNLKKFLEENKISDASIDYVVNSPLPNYLKTGIVSQLLLEDPESNIRAGFLAEFSDSIIDLKAGVDQKAIKKWVRDLLNRPSVEEIRVLMANLPNGVDSRAAVVAWERHILPHYANEFNISYQQFRNLKKEMLLFKDQVLEKSGMNPQEFFEVFDRHFVKALKVNLNQCLEPEEMILKILLRGSVS